MSDAFTPEALTRRMPMSRTAFLGAALVVGLLAGQAAAQPFRAPINPSAERGRQVAERVCASCHAITDKGDSPSAMAPPFRALRMRYNPISMERHIGDLATSGYYGMPRQQVSPAETADIAAYIETLRVP